MRAPLASAETADDGTASVESAAPVIIVEKENSEDDHVFDRCSSGGGGKMPGKEA